MRGAGVKTAVGTVVVSVAVAGIFLWTGTRSSVALADVLVKVEQVPAFMYKMTMRVKGGMQGMALPDHDVETSVLIASEYGMRMDTSSSDPNGSPGMMQQMYVLPQQNQMLMLMPAMKKYIRMEVDAQMFEERRQEGNDPRLMLKKILECEYTDLGKTVLDGVEVRGFQTTDPAFGEGLGDINVKVWVDRKTELPVRVDLKFRMGERMEMEGTLHDFQWDVPVSAAEFNPVIPPDFTPGPGDGLKVPPMTEETAIAGLKLCYELNGKYPDDLNLMTLIRVMTEGFKDKWTAATPESPQPPDLTALLERMKKSRLEMPPEPPSPSASRLLSFR